MQTKDHAILDTAPQEVLAWLLTTTTRSRPREFLQMHILDPYQELLCVTKKCRGPSTLFFFI